MTASLSYTVPGKPVTWARARTRHGRHYTAPKQASAKLAHHLAAAASRGRRPWPLDGAFAVDVLGVYTSAVVGDCDRLASLPLDALEGLLWHTDRQVREVRARIETGPKPFTSVIVTRLDADPVARTTLTRTGTRGVGTPVRAARGGNAALAPSRGGKGL